MFLSVGLLSAPQFFSFILFNRIKIANDIHLLHEAYDVNRLIEMEIQIFEMRVGR